MCDLYEIRDIETNHIIHPNHCTIDGNGYIFLWDWEKSRWDLKLKGYKATFWATHPLIAEAIERSSKSMRTSSEPGFPLQSTSVSLGTSR
jgi:hypothetical protein